MRNALQASLSWCTYFLKRQLGKSIANFVKKFLHTFNGYVPPCLQMKRLPGWSLNQAAREDNTSALLHPTGALSCVYNEI
jgi:hypothetical protein